MLIQKCSIEVWKLEYGNQSLETIVCLVSY